MHCEFVVVVVVVVVGVVVVVVVVVVAAAAPAAPAVLPLPKSIYVIFYGINSALNLVLVLLLWSIH